MSLKNAIAIGKGLGNLIEVGDVSGANLTLKSYLKLLVEIDVYAPLNPGFYLYREGGELIWISLKYERLDIYCINCGRIGHMNHNYHASLEECFPDKYSISLKVNISLTCFLLFLVHGAT